MAESSLTKRIHVSGLTPAISQSDLQQRFQTFGSVKAVDGVGLLDGNGQPRKFAYVTLETTQPKLSRCMNVLSGSTWKGAKLRLGEAKPDWKSRIVHEQSQPLKRAAGVEMIRPTEKARLLAERRKRRLRALRPREAGDMSLVNLENVGKRKGWKTTPLGHLIRPLRMRPTHPLPTLLPSSKPKTQTSTSKGKEKAKPPLSRAFRTAIDPTRYNPVHVMGISGILGEEAEGNSVGRGLWEYDATGKWLKIVDGAVKDVEEARPKPRPQRAQKETMPKVVRVNDTPTNLPTSPPVRTVQPPSTITHSVRPSEPSENIELMLEEEKTRSLSLLNGLFTHGEGPQWDSGDETLGLDLARTLEHGKKKENVADVVKDETMDEDDEDDEDEDADEPRAAAESSSRPPVVKYASPPPKVQVNSLKSIFAPREEEAGFSLFSNLEASGVELELELDETQAAPPAPSVVPVAAQTIASLPPPLIPDPSFDPSPKIALFFPKSEAERTKGRKTRDLFDVAEDNGWNFKGFWRIETEDEIRKRWDEVKGELTKDYKRRHREAIKRKRRGHGGAADVDGVE